MAREPLKYEKIKGTKITRCPRRVISIVCEHVCDDNPDADELKYKVSRLIRWCIVSARYTDGGLWYTETYEGTDSKSQWETLNSLVVGRRQYWIIVPSVSEWLAVSGGYAELTEGNLWIPGLTLPLKEEYLPSPQAESQNPGYLIVGGTTEIIHGRIGKTDSHIVSACNYGLTDMSALLESYFGVLRQPRITGSTMNRFVDESRAVATALNKWYRSYIDEWRDNDCGTWGHTAAQLSHSYWRRKHATGTVVRHQNVDAHKLERAALFGGRADIYRYGVHHENFYHVDVRSMYPSIIAGNDCPTAFTTYGDSISARYILDCMETHCAIARVRIETDRDKYPFKYAVGGENVADRPSEYRKVKWVPRQTIIMYPVGEFITTLVGDDLRDAILSGECKEIYEYSLYRYSSEFRPMMTELMEKRQFYDSIQDGIRSSFYKLLANSFAGKFARQPGGWTTDKRYTADEAWSEWVDTDPETGMPVRCRSIGFVPQVWVERTDEPNGVPVILAWLTMMGRRQLAKLVHIAGEVNVYETDTDGLWVNSKGLERLQASQGICGSGFGQIRIKHTATELELITPRHYRYDNNWVLAGFAAGYDVSPDGTIHDYSRQTLYPTRSGDGPEGVKVTYRSSNIHYHGDSSRQWIRGGFTIPHRIDPYSHRIIVPKNAYKPPVQLTLI